MTTARTIVQDSLLELGVVADGEPMRPSQAQDGLRRLNGLLGLWAMEQTYIPVATITTVPLVVGKQSYTIGPGQEIDVPWPLDIELAQLRILTFSQNLDLPLAVVEEQEYAQVRLKQLQSTYPQAIFLHTTFPFGTLFIWPVATEANELILWHRGNLGEFTSLDAPDIAFQPGMDLTLIYNLAEFLAPSYGIDVVRGSTIERMARQTRATIQRANTKKKLSRLHVPTSYSRGRGGYNWLTDSANGYR